MIRTSRAHSRPLIKATAAIAGMGIKVMMKAFNKPKGKISQKPNQIDIMCKHFHLLKKNSTTHKQLYQPNHRVNCSTIAFELQIWIVVEGIVTKMATYDPRFALVTQPRNALGFACTCPECERAVTERKI